MSYMNKRHYVATVAAAALMVGVQSAHAAGFQLKEQSAEGQGNSFAGQTAKAYDASTIFFNPAGMALLERNEIQTNITYIAPSADYNHESYSSVAASQFSKTDQNGGVSAFVPAFYAAHKVNDRVSVGVAVNSPFGLSTEYDSDWVGANANVKSEIITVNVSPSLSYRVNDKLSLGGSIQFQKAAGELSREVTIGANTSTPTIMKARGMGYGYTLGAVYQYSDKGRIGVNYRSDIRHNLKGTVQVVGVSMVDAEAELNLPAVASVGLYHELDDKWTVLADLAWTNWSLFDELHVVNSSTGAAISTTEYKWDDTLFFALGANYQYSDKLKLQFGVAYDEGASPDETRTAGIPDTDRYWTSVGAGYDINDDMTINFGYSHIFAKDARVSDTRTSSAVAVSYSGEFDSHVDILSLGLTYKY